MKSGQPWYVSHAEALAQNIIGLIISFIILKLWGLSTSDSLGLQVIFFITSYTRSYLIRRFFNNLEIKNAMKKDL